MSGAIKAIGGTIGSIFSPPKIKTEKPPPIIPVTSPEVMAKAARDRIRAKANRGREGTIYSQNYSGTSLGGTS